MLRMHLFNIALQIMVIQNCGNITQNQWTFLKKSVLFSPLSVLVYCSYILFISSCFISIILFQVFFLLTVLYSLLFYKKFHCPRCPNFSCPFNKVDKKVVDQFLDKNPVIIKKLSNLNFESESRRLHFFMFLIWEKILWKK